MKNACEAAIDHAAKSNGQSPAEHAQNNSGSPQEAAVALSVQTQGKQVRFTVKDNGAGISGQVRARLFEPFISDKTQGTGLGLAITRRLIEDIGGSVALVSTGETGTEFSAVVPKVAVKVSTTISPKLAVKG